MTKILLVEDDSNLREIYGARLEAEGYEISSANDGEEGLALAVREHPDLIITDIMMPKISGFDMLDILRSTPETKDVKIIMMTALSQDEDKQRGKDLGADRYIVKSQVTLDDVVSIVREILSSVPTPSSGSTSTTSGADDTATTTEDPALATIDQEVEQFVANSPLMNGTPPQPLSSASNENTQNTTTPPQAA